MNFVAHTGHLIETNRHLIDGIGPTHVAFTDDDRPKHSIHVAVENTEQFVELIVWDSGEAELAFGRPSAAHEEHHDLISIEELDGLFGRFLARAAELRE